MVGVVPVPVEAERPGQVTQSTHRSSMKAKSQVSEVCGLRDQGAGMLGTEPGKPGDGARLGGRVMKLLPGNASISAVLGQEARLLGASETQSFGDGIGGREGEETGLCLGVEPR